MNINPAFGFIGFRETVQLLHGLSFITENTGTGSLKQVFASIEIYQYSQKSPLLPFGLVQDRGSIIGPLVGAPKTHAKP